MDKKIYMSPFASHSKIHPTEIKMAALKIEMGTNIRYNRDINEVIEMDDGRHMFLTYQFRIDDDNDDCIYIKNARWSKKKGKRK